MNDKKYVKTKVRKSLRKLFNAQYLTCYELNRLNVLSAMVSGMIHSGQSCLEQLALSSCEGVKLESKIRQFERFVKNRHVDVRQYYLPFIQVLLLNLSKSGRLVFSIDGSVVGKGCICLMFSVIWRGKAIPVVWQVYRRKKGHMPEAYHRALLKSLQELIPADCEVVITGDGEFDGCCWQEDIVNYGWDYVLRTGKAVLLTTSNGDTFKAGSLRLAGGKDRYVEQVEFTKKRWMTNVLFWRAKGHAEGLILLTNLDYTPQIKQLYKKRFKIEPFFGDLKSRGFRIQRSGLRDPERLDRLLLAACIAYDFCLMAGAKAYKSKFYDQIAKKDKRALSIFQLGKRFLHHLIDLRQWRSFCWIKDLTPDPPMTFNCVPF